MRKMIVFAAVVGLAATTHAAQAPGQKCQSGKNQEAGKYASCLSKAEAKLLKTSGSCSLTMSTDCYDDGDCPISETCIKDQTKYAAAVTKCADKFEAKWGTLTQKAVEALDPCPDGLLAEEIEEVVDEHVANVAAGLAGEGLSDCAGDLATCEGDLATCEGDLATCQAGAQGQRVKTGQTQCWNAGGTLISCTGTGQDGELQKGLTVSFSDNGNGTISDLRTGLMWERLNDGGEINDKDATFNWTNAFNKVKVLNGDATGCIGAGHPSSCCTGAGTGSCTAFAGHTDWRLPNVNELQSLANYGTFNPGTHAAFQSSCTASCTTCSCTQSSNYWTATTPQTNPSYAWFVEFNEGYVGTLGKANHVYVRAVRSGS